MAEDVAPQKGCSRQGGAAGLRQARAAGPGIVNRLIADLQQAALSDGKLSSRPASCTRADGLSCLQAPWVPCMHLAVGQHLTAAIVTGDQAMAA